MATLFEIWLVGDNASYLQSVAFQAWAELDRLELMLSRFDERAEVARINRDGAVRPVRVEVELFKILKDCEDWRKKTQGYFNVCKASVPDAKMMLEEEKRTVFLKDEGCFLDFGGYGKGYALDVMARVAKAYGIVSGFIQGGTSSVLTWGEKETGNWCVDIAHYGSNKEVVDKKNLKNCGFSYSATTSSGRHVTDLINPLTGEQVVAPGACWVIGPTALQPEVMTTAALAMGRERFEQWAHVLHEDNLEVGWV